MEEEPTPLYESKKPKSSIDHIIKFNEKVYNINFNFTNEEMELTINDTKTQSNPFFSNSFTLKQLQNLNNYFKMFDKMDDVITNLINLFEENKFKLLINDKSIIIDFFPGIIIKGEIKFILNLREKTTNEKINDLTILTSSILKRLDILEKENSELKEKVRELTNKLNEYTHPKETDFFQDSVILSKKKDIETMLNMMNKKIKSVALLYRGTRDGDNARNFHEKCDNKGPTLTLCKGKDGNIFGGYTEAEWDSKGRHPKYDKNAFIFSVTKNKKFNSKNYENSIECNPNFGPVFGFGGDLTIRNKYFSTSLNNMWSEQKTYFDENYETSNGKKFSLDELEVYSIKLYI